MRASQNIFVFHPVELHESIAGFITYDSGWYSPHHSAIRDILDEDSIRPNCHMIANFDIAENFRPWGYVNEIPNFRQTEFFTAAGIPNRTFVTDIQKFPVLCFSSNKNGAIMPDVKPGPMSSSDSM